MDESPKTKYNKSDFGEVVEKIDLNNLKQVNHTKHEHIWIRDAEETDDYYAMKCSNPRCFRGYLVSKK